MEAHLEATNSIRSWKRKQKIPKVRKRERTRKHKSSRGAGSVSIKKLTASTSLITTRPVLPCSPPHPDSLSQLHCVVKMIFVCFANQWSSLVDKASAILKR